MTLVASTIEYKHNEATCDYRTKPSDHEGHTSCMLYVANLQAKPATLDQ